MESNAEESELIPLVCSLLALFAAIATGYFAIRRSWWLVLSFGFLTLTVAAVLVRLADYYYVPQAIGGTLDWFASPGEFIWWSTIGGAFAGYPSTLPGIILLIVSNTVIWTVASACIARVGKWALSFL